MTFKSITYIERILEFDYDDLSGVYLGPRRPFDDEDLEYLSKEVDDNHGPRDEEKQERPQFSTQELFWNL